MFKVWLGSYRSFCQSLSNVWIVARLHIEETSLGHRHLSNRYRKRLHAFVPISEMDDGSLRRDDFGGNSGQFTIETANAICAAGTTASSHTSGAVSFRNRRHLHLRGRVSLFRTVRLRCLYEFVERLASISRPAVPCHNFSSDPRVFAKTHEGRTGFLCQWHRGRSARMDEP